MQTFLIIALVILCILVVVSLVRGIVAFLRTTKIDIENGTSDNLIEMQTMQNRMMFNRIKYQGLAVLVVAIILAFAR
ncbi:HIG1 domain-containing protein [Allopontixanthobacter sp.]|uniref:HIG1 domain-containing protein n=1 Tax=Allopontixanthobacter sp. TaxID=2906452 RepID=UPI002ABB8435|nr:HIG1 domain-containing protein [Allopontixanthobacter sp.]MDZ4308830.1 HIG1 domain-containing protein [Allopontixanthobacter sp.]